MGRAPCCEKVGLKRGRWTEEEDRLLVDYIKAHGEGGWRSLPKNAGLLRCGKSCRLRWVNYLREDLKRGNISPEEEETILSLQATLGNRWSLIAGHLPGRTDNEIKNYWNSHLSKIAAARAAATAGDIAGESGAGGTSFPPDDDDGSCSDDARSTVVDAVADCKEDGSEDCVTSFTPVHTRRKRKVKARGQNARVESHSHGCGGEDGESRSHCCDHEAAETEKTRKRKKTKEVASHATEKDNGGCAGAPGKRKRRPSEKDVSDKDNSACKNKRKKIHKERPSVDVTLPAGAGEEAVKKETGKKKRKRKPKTSAQEKHPAQVAVSSEEAGGPVTCATTSDATNANAVSADSDNGAGGSCATVPSVACAGGYTCGTDDPMMGRQLADVEEHDSIPAGYGLGGSKFAHVGDNDGVDLLEAIDSDGGLLGLITAETQDPHGDLLLDYLDMSAAHDDGCFWAAGPLPGEEVDSWLGPADDVGVQSTTMGSTGSSCSVATPSCTGSSITTSSSYLDLRQVEEELCGEGPDADDGIASLPWEAEEDLWRLLSEFVGDVQPSGLPETQQQQQLATPMTTQALLSATTASCGDGGFADDASDSPWLQTDMFLSL